jgi:hypothetical protein
MDLMKNWKKQHICISSSKLMNTHAIIEDWGWSPVGRAGGLMSAGKGWFWGLIKSYLIVWVAVTWACTLCENSASEKTRKFTQAYCYS